MKRLLPYVTMILLVGALAPQAPRAAEANALEFLEAFAWGDRAAALKTLVPDTEDYYYYHCLYHQLRGDRPAFQRTLDQWLARNRNHWNPRMQELRRRQVLMDFDHAPDAAWTFLREDLNLAFNHRARHEQRAAQHPTAITPDQYNPDAFMQVARRHGSLLDNLTARGLQLVPDPGGDPDTRRALLGRLEQPDFDGLTALILADLDYKDRQGNIVAFGQHPIHRQLTRAQLEDLGRRRPALLREEAYVAERLARLPPPDVDLAHDPVAAVRHYQELWAFVGELEAMHNSLKASVLYRLLDHQRRLGRYDEPLFRAYLELPRNTAYFPQERRVMLQRQSTPWVDFQYRPGREVILPPIGNEEPLVREFLIELLRTEADTGRYREYFEARWLDAVFAESKILHGVGRPEEWASRLDPAAYRALLERIELNFAPQNPAYVVPGEPVALKVDLKRVDNLLVKIFEIQTFNYYTTHQAPVDQAVDLDGMIATHERTLNAAADPGRRVRHTLALPEITRRGVYVVELIGNGVSSRALLHVGHLEAISLPTPAGQAVMVLNDAGDTVTNAAVWIRGREYPANAQGLVVLPFSEHPGTRFAVLRDGDFCSPENIHHLGEEYVFTAGIHLDPQNLPRRNTGVLILRPDLRIHGIPLDPALLGKVTVTLAAIDAKGVRTAREYTADFTRHAEWSRPFYVPDALRRLDVHVEAKLKRKTDLEEITLSDTRAVDVNGARAGDTLQQVFLTPAAEGWALEVRGLNGEPIAGVPLQVNLRHPGFQRTVDVPVSTDAAGRVALGPLTAISAVSVSGPDGLRLDRAIAGGFAARPDRLHLRPGEAVSLPYPHDRQADLKALSLFQVKGATILADVSAMATLRDGELKIEGLSAGEYQLILHETGERIALEAVEGDARAGFILGAARRLQQTGTQFPSVVTVERQAAEARVRLRHVTPSTRVAVRAYRYMDDGGAFPVGGGFASPAHRRVRPLHAQYVSGRNIGDEYRYVLERRDQTKYAGTLLERPGLILNPWELRETTAEEEQLRQDQAYRGGVQELNVAVMAGEPADRRVALFSSGGGRRERALSGVLPLTPDIGYDFLPQGSRWWVNLTPDADGVLAIPLDALGEHTALEIVVLDRFGTSRSRHLLADRDYEPRDIRLLAGLRPDGAFSRQKTIRRIDANTPVVFPDLATTRYRTIRTIGEAFDLLQTLSGEAALSDFAFLKEWPRLDDATKLKKYGEFACHELHLFLHAHDRAFFDTVVKPYLANKKDATFVDRWLLDALTPEDTRLDRLQERNALELALLARRGGDAAVLQAALREAWELLPPDPEGFARRVRTALQAAELDEAQSLARDRAVEASEIDSVAITRSPVMMKAMLGSRSPSARGSALGSEDAAFSMAPASAAPAPQVSFSLGESVADAEMPEEEIGLMDMPAEDLAEAVPRLYRALPKTKEWAEQNYFRVRARDDVPGRLPVNGFWLDVALGAAVPERLLEAHRHLTDVLAALAFCGLPFDAAAPEELADGPRLTLTVRAPALLVTEQILPAEASADDRPLLLSQQFFRPDDRHRFEGNEQIEKFVTGEFVRRVVYGARVTLTNPTASRRRLNVLLQIPVGAIPLRNGAVTEDVDVLLEAYTTHTVESFFTFPFAGTFPQFPAQAAADETIVGRAEPREFLVVDAPTEEDRTSWAWISQYASPEDTLAFLREHNPRRFNLDEIAWRLRDRGFFEQVTDLLTARGLYHDTTFTYSVHHQDAQRARVWLARSPVRERVGPVLVSPLLTVDPVDAKTYEHLEYDPLVNPRVHPVGATRKILNTALDAQYRAFLRNGLYRAALDNHERLALVYYLLLQDRLTEGAAELARVDAADLHERLQTDYLQAWLALRTLDLDGALARVEPHRTHPAPRWRARFEALAQAIEEARGAEAAGVEDPSRQQDLDRLAAQTPSLELKVEGGRLWVTAHHLPSVTLNLYPMDIELLFSRKPFLAEGGADFAVIKPAFSQEIALDARGEPEALTLPDAFAGRNLMVEVTGRGQRAGVAWYANRLRVRRMESFGQVEVRAAPDGRPLPMAYVKVFARGVDGRVRFWKDGYTDLRGRFDYLSRNDRRLEEAAAFSILILHDELGAEIHTAQPPVR